MNWLINNIASAIIGGIISSIISWTISNIKYLYIWKDLIFRLNKEIRISYGYLFKIKIEDRYLLIKGNRINQYQPIGGVYKYYPSFKSKFDKWEIKEEKDHHFYEKGDIRIFVKGKYLFKLLRWIDTNKNREYNHIREFYEELVHDNEFDASEIFKLNFEFIKRINLGIHYSLQQKCDEMLIFDIVDVVNISKDTKDKIISLVNDNDNFILVGIEEIEKQCFLKDGLSTKIGEHSKYIL